MSSYLLFLLGFVDHDITNMMVWIVTKICTVPMLLNDFVYTLFGRKGGQLLLPLNSPEVQALDELHATVQVAKKDSAMSQDCSCQ